MRTFFFFFNECKDSYTGNDRNNKWIDEKECLKIVLCYNRIMTSAGQNPVKTVHLSLGIAVLIFRTTFFGDGLVFDRYF